MTTGLSVGGADAAIAVTVVNSTATTGVLGGSSIQANGGDLTLAAVNTTNVVTSGDASEAADGGAVAVSVVTTSTQVFISDAGDDQRYWEHLDHRGHQGGRRHHGQGESRWRQLQ